MSLFYFCIILKILHIYFLLSYVYLFNDHCFFFIFLLIFIFELFCILQYVLSFVLYFIWIIWLFSVLFLFLHCFFLCNCLYFVSIFSIFCICSFFVCCTDLFYFNCFVGTIILHIHGIFFFDIYIFIHIKLIVCSIQMLYLFVRYVFFSEIWVLRAHRTC